MVWGVVGGSRRRIRWEGRSYTLGMIRRVGGVLSVEGRLGLRIASLRVELRVVGGLHGWLHEPQMAQRLWEGWCAQTSSGMYVCDIGFRAWAPAKRATCRARALAGRERGRSWVKARPGATWQRFLHVLEWHSCIAAEIEPACQHAQGPDEVRGKEEASAEGERRWRGVICVCARDAVWAD